MHLEQRDLGDRRRGLPRLASVRAAAGDGCRRLVRRQFLHRRAAQHRASARPQAFRADAPRRDLPALCRGRRDLQSGLPGLADPLPARPGADDQDQRASARSTCWAWPSACSAKILQASTSEVYGDPDVHPQTEDYWGNVNPIGPRSCYDEGKRCAETLFFDYRRQHKLRDQGRAHLQHLRPAHAPERRARGVELHRPGAARRATSRSTATARRPAPSAMSTI